MEELAAQKAELKKNWVLTHGAFQKLLDWLSEGAGDSGQKYLEMRRKLVKYFDRKNCQSPDELADKTLDRVARRLEEEGSITGVMPDKFCFTHAKHVSQEEYKRKQKLGQVSVDDLPVSGPLAENPEVVAKLNEEREDQEKRLDCLKRCAQELAPGERELIIRYYQGKGRGKIKNRQALAASLEISIEELRVRACRIRQKLKLCVEKCIGR